MQDVSITDDASLSILRIISLDSRRCVKFYTVY